MINKKELGDLLVDIYLKKLGEIPTIIFLLDSGLTDMELVSLGFLSTDIEKAQEIINNE